MTQSPSQTFRITGLDCAEEVAVLKREVGPVVGGEERLAFDVLNGRMIVSASPDGVPPRAIVDAVKRAGLGAEAVDGNLPIVEPPATFWQQRGRLVLTAVSGVALGAAMIAQHLRVRKRRRQRALRRGDRRGRLARAAQGVGRDPPAAAGHEPADDGGRRRRGRDRRMVRGGHGRVPVFALAALGILERRPRPPGDRRADGPRSADGLAGRQRRLGEASFADRTCRSAPPSW